MSRLIIAYTVAGLVLFGALFTALALSGIARPGSTAEQFAEAEVLAEPPPPPPTAYIPPPLEAERVYRISHETPIYPSPAQNEAERQVLPAGGFFRVLQTLEEPPGPWFEIRISDGAREWTAYLYGMDLRWKTLGPQYSADETDKMHRDEFLQRLRDSGLFARREAVVEVEAELESQPQTFDQWWAEAGERLGGPTAANLIVSAGAAALATVLILGSMAMLAVLRREHTWSRPMMHGNLDGAEDEDDPYGSQSAGEDKDQGEDADVPKLDDRFRL